MMIFVTGASGFVGTKLTGRLEREGHEVFASDLDVDVTSLDAVSLAIERTRPDAIVHLAAQSSVAASLRDPAGTYRINYIGTRTLLQAMEQRAPGARLLLIGSGDQYTPGPSGTAPLTEQAPLLPRSPYARSKAAAEILGTLAARRGLDVVRVRAFNHTGPGQRPDFVVPDFAQQVAEIAAGQREAEMHVGNLDSVRDFLHVDDVIEAYVRLLDKKVPAATYNIASGRGRTVRSVLDTLCELAGVAPRIEVDANRFRPTDSMIGDATRLRRATDWRPTISLRDTLQAMLDHWAAQL